MNEGAHLKPPSAYELKRVVAVGQRSLWKSELLVGLPAAPIYLFPNQDDFARDDVEQIARRFVSDRLHLPHPSAIFEIVDARNGGRSIAIYAREDGDAIDALLFLRPSAMMPWTNTICHTRYLPDGSVSFHSNPSSTGANRENAALVLDDMLMRTTALIMAEACTEERSLSSLRRAKFAKSGVAGWTYRIASLDPAKLRHHADARGGTHASPRWHIRRGHWRTLSDGKRVFVRECEVGDQARGGVVKDYRVELGSAA